MAATKKAANEAFEAFTAAKPEAFKEGYEKIAKGMTNLTNFNKDALEAMIASAGTLTRGVERATADQTAFLKAAYEDSVAVFKATASCKSLLEAIDIQSEYVRSQMTKNLGQLGKMSEHWTATAKEASEPLTRRYGEFVELVQSYRP
jgi:phasin family protein